MLFDWDADGWQSFVSDPDVPPIMQEAGHKGRPQAAGLGGHYDAVGVSTVMDNQGGVIGDLTGPLSFMGIADANVARMVIDEINAGGGLLGRRIELHRRRQ